MKVIFDKEYLKDLYEKGDAGKKHRYQLSIVKRYIRTIDLMIELPNVQSLVLYNSLNYERLKGKKMGISSVRVNDQYRIEFEEITNGEETIASICNIIDLSNHYE